MTAPTQTTSTGWYYADGDPSSDRNGWDGRLWPEITGYRGHDMAVVETVVNGPVIDEPVVVEEPVALELHEAPVAMHIIEVLVEPVLVEPVLEEPVLEDEIEVLEAPVDVVEAQIVAEAEAITEASAKARVKPPRLFEVVELKNAAAKAPVEIPGVREPVVSEGVEPAAELAQPKKGSLGLYLALALILIVIALILGVAL